MQRLILIVQLFKEYIIFAVLVLCSIIFLTFEDNRQIQYIRSLAVAIVGIGENTISSIPNFFELHSENQRLRRRALELYSEVAQLREAQLQNIRLQKLLQFKDTCQFKLQSAEVVCKSLHLLHNTLIINVGLADSVRPPMPVISDAGLVGRISMASQHYSVVQLMLNQDFRASAKTQRSRADGILAWQGGNNTLLKNVSKSQDVAEGDLVITSQYSNTFPKNIEIGTVVHVSDESGTLFKRVEVKPSVDFARVEEVFVIRSVPDSARAAIISRLPKE